MNCAIGNWASVLVPTTKFGSDAQLLMRTSDGCIVSILSALRNPTGEPSKVPTRKIGFDGREKVLAMFAVVVIPAATVIVRLPTSSSPS